MESRSPYPSRTATLLPCFRTGSGMLLRRGTGSGFTGFFEPTSTSAASSLLAQVSCLGARFTTRSDHLAHSMVLKMGWTHRTFLRPEDASASVIDEYCAIRIQRDARRRFPLSSLAATGALLGRTWLQLLSRGQAQLQWLKSGQAGVSRQHQTSLPLHRITNRLQKKATPHSPLGDWDL
jgi:hypothetical protein